MWFQRVWARNKASSIAACMFYLPFTKDGDTLMHDEMLNPLRAGLQGRKIKAETYSKFLFIYLFEVVFFLIRHYSSPGTGEEWNACSGQCWRLTWCYLWQAWKNYTFIFWSQTTWGNFVFWSQTTWGNSVLTRACKIYLVSCWKLQDKAEPIVNRLEKEIHYALNVISHLSLDIATNKAYHWHLFFDNQSLTFLSQFFLWPSKRWWPS